MGLNIIPCQKTNRLMTNCAMTLHNNRYLCFILCLVIAIFGSIQPISAQMSRAILTSNTSSTAISLAIVFDTTGSMGNDLQQVKMGIKRIVDTHLKRGEIIKDFIVVSVHDPDVNVKVTESSKIFREILSGIYTHGGGDCPERTITGIKMALENARPNSLVYVFTDSSANDANITGQVLDLIQKTQSQVTFVLTGYCNSTEDPGFLAYQKIATISSGQVYIIKKGQVKDFMRIIESAVEALRVQILQEDTERPGPRTYTFPVDLHLKQINIQVSSYKSNKTITVNIRDPKGKKITEAEGLKRLMDNVPTVFVGSVDSPAPGIWTLEVSTNDLPHSVRITGNSPVDFLQGFATTPSDNNAYTSRRPIRGIKNYMMVNMTGNFLPGGSLSLFNLVSVNGTSLVQLEVEQVGQTPIYKSKYPFDASMMGHYYLKVSGRDGQGNNIQRYSKTAISARDPRNVSVSCPATVTVKRAASTNISCFVDSEIPFKVNWYKNNVQLRGYADENKHYTLPTNVTFFITDANEESGGIYSVKLMPYEQQVASFKGVTEDKVGVTILPPPPRVMVSRNSSIQPETTATLTCNIFSEAKDIDVSWFRVIPKFELKNDRRYRIDTSTINGALTSKLQILQATESDGGEYMCQAEHLGGSTSASGFVKIHLPPKVIVDNIKVSFKKEESFNLICRGDGTPTPKLSWAFNGVPITNGDKYEIREQYMESQLMVRLGQPSDAGRYTCTAVNPAGTHDGSYTVIYVSPPEVDNIIKSVERPAQDTPLTMRCMATGIPQPAVRWEFNGSPVSENGNIKINETTGEIYIALVDRQMKGSWTCVAVNEAGVGRKSFLQDVGFAPKMLTYQQDTTVSYGENATLKCILEGHPMPDVKWFRGATGSEMIPIRYGEKKLFNQDKSLTIIGVTLEDKGAYTCVGVNAYGKVEGSINVEVGGTSPPEISFTQPKQEALEGEDKKILTCLVLNAKPPATVSWMRDGVEIMPSSVRIIENGRLIIRDVKLVDEGRYTCVAKNIVGQSKFDVQLDVQTKPVIEGKQREILTVLQGEKVELNCKATSDPPPKITWRKDGKPIMPQARSSFLFSDAERTITIYSAAADDAGTITCTAANPHAAAVKEFILEVKVPPTLSKEGPDNFEIGKGESVQLSCLVVSPPGFTKIEWYKDSQPLTLIPGRVVQVDQTTLEVFGINDEESGSYECRAENDAGLDSRYFQITVLVAPKASSSEVIKIYTTVGSEVYLPCKIEGYPMPVKTWFYAGSSLEPNNNPYGIRSAPTDKADLFIPSMTADLQGKYTCEGRNKGGVGTLEYAVIILKKPQIIKIPEKSLVFTDSTITLICEAVGSPDPKVTWMFKDKAITKDTPGYQYLKPGTVMIDKATWSHGGKYTCQAENEAGTDSKETVVIVYSPDYGGTRTPVNMTSTPVLRGGNITFTCVMNSTPPAEIKWFKDNIDIAKALPENRFTINSEGSALTIYNVTEADKGQFKCLAINLPGQISKNFSLIVQVSPYISRRRSSAKEVNVHMSADLELRCTAEGAPDPKISWYKGNTQITSSARTQFRENSAVMIVYRATLEDEAVYSCKAVNEAGQDTKEFRVNVLIPPTIADRDTHSSPDLLKGQSASLFCNVTGNPPPDITWSVEPDENNFLERNAQFFNNKSQLFIPSVKLDSIRRYLCTATNSAGMDRKAFDPVLVYPPEITSRQGPPENEILVGGDTRLSCDVIGSPEPKVEWFKDGDPIKDGDLPRVNITSRNMRLHLFGAKDMDTGSYKCIATNKYGQARQQWKVEVMIPATFGAASMEGKKPVALGSSLTLFCTGKGKPQPTVEWLKDGAPINPTSVSVGPDNTQITVSAVTENDAGRYTCRISNKYGTDAKSFDVDVTFAPRLREGAQRYYVMDKLMGNAALIDCLVDGSPAPIIKWYKDGRPFNQLPVRYRLLNNNQQLEIVQLKPGDAGRYSCAATNVFGDFEVVTELTVGAPARINRHRIRTEYTVKVGEELQLPCPATGSPAPDITFNKDSLPLDQSLPGDVTRRSGVIVSQERQMLTIIRAAKIDAGTYQCNASNPISWDLVEYMVRVISPPAFDTSNYQTQVYWFTNQTRFLECTLTGEADPPAKISWERRGSPLLEGPNIRISSDGTKVTIVNVQQYDAGEYRCLAKNEVASVSQDFDVQVYVKPRFFDPTTYVVIEAVQNATVKLSCEATGQPRPTFIWQRGNRDIAPEQSSYQNMALTRDNQVLQISNIQTYDQSEYTCTVINGGGSIEKKFNVTVSVPPRIKKRTHGTEEMTTFENIPVSMHCEVYDLSRSRVSISWSWNGADILQDDREFYLISNNGQSLSILRPSIRQAGKYKCKAENMAGYDSHVFQLKVVAAPRFPTGFVRYRQTITVEIGTKVTLECPVTGSPPPLISWFFNNTPLDRYTGPNIIFRDEQKILEIPSVQKDAGQYQCVARNEGGNISKTYDLEVIMAPVVRLDKTDVSEREGTTFTVICTAKGFPKPDVKWTRDGLGLFRLGTSVDPFTGELTISEAREEDSGRYTCTASNKIGQSSKSVAIKIIARPTVITPLTPIQAKVGDQVLLPCKVTGTYPIVVNWIEPNGNQITKSSPGSYRVLQDQGLMLERVDRIHAGRYRCSASNSAGFQDGYVTLQVLVAPKLERPANTTLVGLLNSVMQVQCKVKEGLPAPTVVWERNGVVFSKFKNYYTTTDSGLFVFNTLKEEDEGDLTCVAKNVAGDDRVTFRVVVELLPKVSLPVSTLGYEGRTVTIRCRVEGRPPPTVTWEMNGQPLTTLGSRVRMNGDEEFTIYDLKPSDAGSYVCFGRRRGVNTVQATTYLTIFTKPTFVKTPATTVTHYEGRWIQFLCNAKGEPRPDIRWFKDGNMLTSEKSTNVRGMGSLTLGPLRTEQAGQYSCEAKNDVGKELYTFNFIVKTRPFVNVYMSDAPISETKSTTLFCNVDGEADSVIWLKDGQLVQNTSRISLTNSSLIILDAKAGDTGTYQCVATNPVGEDQGEVKVFIRSIPRFTQEPSDMSVNTGGILSLPCAAGGYPSPIIQWFKDMRPVNLNATHSIINNGTLRIVGVSAVTSGIYQCVATNDLGEAQSRRANIRVTVHGDWSDWSSWSTCTTTCGPGISSRRRSCTNPPPSNGGMHCSGEGMESRQCLAMFCPANGQWSQWGHWSGCSISCGAGLRQRSRRCDSPPPANGGMPCHGDSMQDVLCEDNPSCPVNGAWSPWTPWTPCSVSCGDGGTQKTSRQCNNPPPSNGGFDCPSKGLKVRACSPQPCPLGGGWSEWGYWSICSRSCGIGTQRKTRTCTNPMPEHGGPVCEGHDALTRDCNTSPCPINGEWSNWSSWSPCSHSCGTGVHSRDRSCTEPSPSYGGKWCSGLAKMSRLCPPESQPPCPGGGGENEGWGEWSGWSTCSKTCGSDGQRERTRVCLDEIKCRQGLTGLNANKETQPCSSLPKCPTDNMFGKIPTTADGEITGTINNKDIGLIRLKANWTAVGAKKTSFDVFLSQIQDKDMGCFQILTGLISPLLWVGAYQVADASNGQTVTSGIFKRESVVQFADGSSMRLIHNSRLISGKHQLRTQVYGKCPRDQPDSSIDFNKYVEKYVQMNPTISVIHSDSSRFYRQSSGVEPYSWSHNTTSASGTRQRYLVQQLLVNDITSLPGQSGKLKFSASAVIAKDDDGDTCPNGFRLLKHLHYCIDVDECTEASPASPLLSMAGCDQICENTVPLYRCTCRPGFYLHQDGHSCLDVDECIRGNHRCHPDTQTCFNMPGSYSCVTKCASGLQLDPTTNRCKDIDECATKSGICGDHQCINSHGSYMCSCRPGYQMVGSLCQDIDECRTNAHNCQAHERCVNQLGSHQCQPACSTGYRVDSRTGSCVDVNECAIGTSKCPSDASCVNTEGSFICQCKSGFTMTDGNMCRDVNECVTTPNICSYTCRNTWGSYECFCPSGQIRSADKKSCIDTSNRCKVGMKWLPDRGCIDEDECNPLDGRIPCQYKCINTYGSYQCVCPAGYTLDSNAKQCRDIDECSLNPDLCNESQLCLNTKGNFTCVDVMCPDKYTFDRRRKTCKIRCSDSNLTCPGNSDFAEKIQYLIINMPSHQGATVKVRVVNTLQEHQQFCRYQMLKSSPDNPFSYRSQDGVVYLTLVNRTPLAGVGLVETDMSNQRRGRGKIMSSAYAPTSDSDATNAAFTKLYHMFFRVKCYSSATLDQLIFQNSFYIYITIAKYPF